MATRFYSDYYVAEIISESKLIESLTTEVNLCAGSSEPLSEEELKSTYEKLLNLSESTERIKKLLGDVVLLANQATQIETPFATAPVSQPPAREAKFTPINIGATVAIKRAESTDDEWMLAVTVAFDPVKMEYIVEDVSEDEEDESGRGRQFSVPWTYIRALPESDVTALKEREFPMGHFVAALFPTTTCLYRARVVGVPVKRKKNYEYLLQFDNDEIDGIIPTRPVAARYVMDWPGSI